MVSRHRRALHVAVVLGDRLLSTIDGGLTQGQAKAVAAAITNVVG